MLVAWLESFFAVNNARGGFLSNFDTFLSALCPQSSAEIGSLLLLYGRMLVFSRSVLHSHSSWLELRPESNGDLHRPTCSSEATE